MTEREKLEGVIGDVYVDTHELEKELKKKLDADEVYSEGKKVFVLFERRGEEYELELDVKDKYYHVVAVKK
ncbi:hypothetical protein [Lacrimispora sp.]|uniref:hypothetical protein n=1 Tax=Lacrimispora sp. TaxID=2719234 RepID=UPI002FD92638